MAGIGWKLQRMIDRGSLASTAGAYLTGAAVTSAPWLLTTAVLTSLRMLSRSDGIPAFAGVERVVTLVYAVTIVTSAPVHVVVSRYAADRLYDHRLERIAAPLWRALALILAGSAALGAGLMALLRVPLEVGAAGTVLTAIIGAQWLLLSVCGGMVSPAALLRAFALGAPLGIGAALLFERRFVGGDAGYLLGFASGQLVTLALLLQATVRALPAEVAEDARLAPAFAEYYLLALAAFTYHLAIWADKLMVWLIAGKRAAALYASVAALAWFSTIPAFGWMYVQVETSFYRHFRRFYDDLEGGAPLGRLREGATLVSSEAYRIMRGAAVLQASVTLIVLVAAPTVVRAAALPAEALAPLRSAIGGAALQVLALLAILFLYYFDLRREALAVSLTLLAGEAVFVGASRLTGWAPATGYPLACAGAVLLGFLLVRERLRTLLADTFQSQPSGSA